MRLVSSTGQSTVSDGLASDGFVGEGHSDDGIDSGQLVSHGVVVCRDDHSSRRLTCATIIIRAPGTADGERHPGLCPKGGSSAGGEASVIVSFVWVVGVPKGA